MKSIGAAIIVLSGSICLVAASIAQSSPFQLAVMILGGVLVFMGLMTWTRHDAPAEARKQHHFDRDAPGSDTP